MYLHPTNKFKIYNTRPSYRYISNPNLDQGRRSGELCSHNETRTTDSLAPTKYSGTCFSRGYRLLAKFIIIITTFYGNPCISGIKYNQSTERTERRGQIYQFYNKFSLPMLSGSSFTPFHIFLRLKLLDHCSFVPFLW